LSDAERLDAACPIGMAETTMTGARNPFSRQRAAPYIFHHTNEAMHRFIADLVDSNAE